MSYLVDTDVVIDAIGQFWHAVDTLERFAPEGLFVSIISYGELHEGSLGAADPQVSSAGYKAYLIKFPTLGLTESIMEQFAAQRARLRAMGQLIPDMDLLIAATALEHDLTLITRNRRHFGRIHQLETYSPGL